MPPKGNINLTIFAADRTLWADGKVHLWVVDPFSDTPKFMAEDSVPGPTVLIENVLSDKGRVYAMLVSAPGYRDAGIYPVKTRANGLVQAAVMMMPKNAGFSFPSPLLPRLKDYTPLFWKALVEGGITEAALAENTEQERLACALNIEAKLRNTRVGGVPAMEFLRSIDGIKGIGRDHIRCKFDKTILEKLQADVGAEGGFVSLRPNTFKQKGPFGCLQLTFHGDTTGDLLDTEVEIDLWSDIAQFGEFLRNKIGEQKTDPLAVYRLLFDQRIFPHYVVQDLGKQ